MDTAKVEIGKLQVLCDRINSMLDALNQVRLSVHGLQNNPTGPTPTTPWTHWQTATPWQSAYPTGIAHTNPWWNWQTPVGFTPNWLPTNWTPNTNPWFARTTPFINPFNTPFQAYNTPIQASFTHSTPETLYNPLFAAQIANSFPFAFTPNVNPNLGANLSTNLGNGSVNGGQPPVV